MAEIQYVVIFLINILDGRERTPLSRYSLIGNLVQIFTCLKLSVLQFFSFYKCLIGFAISLIMVDTITIIMSSPRQWLECLGSACKDSERKCMSQNAKCMTFGGISHFHIHHSEKGERYRNWKAWVCPLLWVPHILTTGSLGRKSLLKGWCSSLRGHALIGMFWICRKMTFDVVSVSVQPKWFSPTSTK